MVHLLARVPYQIGSTGKCRSNVERYHLLKGGHTLVGATTSLKVARLATFHQLGFDERRKQMIFDRIGRTFALHQAIVMPAKIEKLEKDVPLKIIAKIELLSTLRFRWLLIELVYLFRQQILELLDVPLLRNYLLDQRLVEND